MLLRTLVVLAALSATMAAAQAAIVITVDKSAQTLSVAVNGEERHSWPVSTGRAGYSTPTGSFTAFRLAKEHFSKEWDDAPMPHSIFFTQRGHAIHGSLETRRLGTPASHGCVRLSPANAETLFNLVKADGLSTTKVVITGEDKAPAVAVARRRPATREASRRRERLTRQASAPRQRVRVVEVRRSRVRQRTLSAPVYMVPVYGGDYWGWNGGWN